MAHKDKAVRLQAVAFQQISKILGVTDALGLNREGVGIPLFPECSDIVRRVPSGRIESLVDPEKLFDQWRTVLPISIQGIQRS